MLADTLPRQRLWPTLGWTGAGALALVVAQLLGLLVCIAVIWVNGGGSPNIHSGIGQVGPLLLGSAVLSSLWTILFMLGLTRIRTPEVREYLALRWPTARRFAFCLLGFIAFMILQALLSGHLEHANDAKFMQDLVSSAREPSAVLIMVAAVLIAAPLGEELVFRGFLYRTLELKFGSVVAIVATALGWAVMHVQYSLTAILIIFAGGLLFGVIRRYSRSLYATMLFHALWNGAALAGAMLITSKI